MNEVNPAGMIADHATYQTTIDLPEDIRASHRDRLHPAAGMAGTSETVASGSLDADGGPRIAAARRRSGLKSLLLAGSAVVLVGAVCAGIILHKRIVPFIHHLELRYAVVASHTLKLPKAVLPSAVLNRQSGPASLAHQQAEALPAGSPPLTINKVAPKAIGAAAGKAGSSSTVPANTASAPSSPAPLAGAAELEALRSNSPSSPVAVNPGKAGTSTLKHPASVTATQPQATGKQGAAATPSAPAGIHPLVKPAAVVLNTNGSQPLIAGSGTQLAQPAHPAPAAPATLLAAPAQDGAMTLHPVAHPVQTGVHLVAAPMSRHHQVMVVSMVSQLSQLVGELRTENGALANQVQAMRTEMNARLGDFNRRLTFDQAKDRLALAEAPHPSMTAIPTRPSRIFPARSSAPVAAASPASYHIEAASPGLAMLSHDGQASEVSIGSAVPGVGRVVSIYQIGTNWVVRTTHGLIR